MRKSLLRTFGLTAALGLAVIANAQEASPSAADLAAKMNAMTGTDWHPGVELGDQLASLPGHQGFEILRDNWKKGANVEPRKQMFKGWVFRSHPDTLKVLNLGATDSDITMQNWAFEYLKGIAFQDFAEDYTAYRKWFAQYGEMPLSEVKKANAQIFVDRLVASKGADREHYYRMLSNTDMGKVIDRPETALNLVREIATDPKSSQDALRAAGSLIKIGKPDEAFLKEVIAPLLDSSSGEGQFFAARQLGDFKADWALDMLMAKVRMHVAKGDKVNLFSYAMGIAAQNNPRIIPETIAIIASDNTTDTVYGLGYFALWPLTGVSYEESHDGAWWKAWWEKNHSRFPDPVGSMPLPVIPPNPNFVEPKKNATGTDEKPLEAILVALREGKTQDLSTNASKLANQKDYTAIPTLIGAIVSENTYNTVYGLGYFGLTPLTGVSYDESHDGAWWKKWWTKNKSRFPAKVARMSIPEVKAKLAVSDPMVPNQPDVADIPSENLYAKGNKDMRYLLAGPVGEAKAPKEGYKLFVILPGGDGSADFHPFLKRVLREALPANSILAEPVAKKWSDKQFEKIVWPTRTNPWPGATFTTEEFIESVIADVKKKRKVDPSAIYTVGWSSSGPPVYAHLMSPHRSSAGAFVAMSIFNTSILPKVDNVKGVRVSILHSPQDFIPIVQAEAARDTLKQAGADVEYDTYEGGHGWQGDVFGNIRRAVAHLTGK